MIIKILGSGCSRCEKMYKKVSEAAAKNNIDAEIIKVDDAREFARYGILITPALVINEKLKCSINVPNEKQILKYITEEL
jgi:small redox-active disulfide protein 2